MVCAEFVYSYLATPPSSHLFPPIIADLLRTYGVSHMSLSLTQGYYRPPHWGYPAQPHASPHGARVRAVFDRDPAAIGEDDVDRRWQDLVRMRACASTNGEFLGSRKNNSCLPTQKTRAHVHPPIHALSGYFCASLSTMHPKYTSEPSPLTSSVNRTAHAERAGMLSSENVCTENLTPWKKLLPCKKVRFCWKFPRFFSMPFSFSVVSPRC